MGRRLGPVTSELAYGAILCLAAGVYLGTSNADWRLFLSGVFLGLATLGSYLWSRHQRRSAAARSHNGESLDP